jgi:GTP-binding protein HflX
VARSSSRTRDASLLLHVIDASDPHHEDRMRQVEDVLGEVGADNVPVLRVYNKIDDISGSLELDGVSHAKVCVSARTGDGVQGLLHAIRAEVVGAPVAGELRLEPAQNRIRAQLFDWDAVRSERIDAFGRFTLEVELSARRWRELSEKEGLSRDCISQKA